MTGQGYLARKWLSWDRKSDLQVISQGLSLTMVVVHTISPLVMCFRCYLFINSLGFRKVTNPHWKHVSKGEKTSVKQKICYKHIPTPRGVNNFYSDLLCLCSQTQHAGQMGADLGLERSEFLYEITLIRKPFSPSLAVSFHVGGTRCVYVLTSPAPCLLWSGGGRVTDLIITLVTNEWGISRVSSATLFCVLM